MEKQLNEMLASIEQQFEALGERRKEDEAEMYRLQGEYRRVQAILENLPAEPKEEKDGTRVRRPRTVSA